MVPVGVASGTERVSGVTAAAVAVPAEATTVEATTVEATIMDTSEGMDIDKHVRGISVYLECLGMDGGQG